MDVNALRTAVAALLPTSPWQVYDYVPTSPNLPALCVGLPESLTPGATWGGYWTVVLPLFVLVSMADERDAQRRLAQVLSNSPGTLLDTLNTNRNTSPWRSLNVASVNNVSVLKIGPSTEALTAQINLSIIVQ